MQVVILAGGLATRLRPLTEKIPKSLLPVAGTPFIDYQLALLKQAHVEDVVLCVGHLGQQIRVHCGDGSAYRLKIRYSEDGPESLGTGGALRQAAPLLRDQFSVVYGDSYLNCDYQRIWRYFSERSELGLMTVYANHNQFDQSNVEIAGGYVTVYDKERRTERMTFIDYGLSLFRREVFDVIPAKKKVFDLSDVHQALVHTKQLLAYHVPARFYEVGSRKGLSEFTRLAGDRNVQRRATA